MVAAGRRDRVLKDIAAEQAGKVAQRLLMSTGLKLDTYD